MSAPVVGATLTLSCTNPTSDGGTLYPVADSSWLEGDRNGLDAGSAGGPGLTWTQVDTNGNQQIDASDSSPYVPLLAEPVRALGPVQAGQSYTVDVTSAFQAGPRLYTLALKSANSNGAWYASRQHPTVGRRPVLRLTLGSGSP